MSLTRSFVDTAVFVYAVGADHPYREPCRRLVGALATGDFDGEASVEVVAEFLHQRTRRTGDRTQAARAAQDVAALCVLHDVTVADLQTAVALFSTHGRLHSRDALHAGVALNRGIGTIITPDTAFDDVPGLTRLDPQEAAARL